MGTSRYGDPLIDALYTARKDLVDFVAVPELGYAVVEGSGAPGDAAFTDAIQALYAVSYGAHFAVRKATGDAPRVMPLEALWWIEGVDAEQAMARIAAQGSLPGDAGRNRWRWRAMILQLPPVDEQLVKQAAEEAMAKRANPALDRLHYQTWAEGLCAQTLHVGPYSAEPATIESLHRAIVDQGLRPSGHHHEIYLGDPRRSAREKLRTILRQPLEAVHHAFAGGGVRAVHPAAGTSP